MMEKLTLEIEAMERINNAQKDVSHLMNSNRNT